MAELPPSNNGLVLPDEIQCSTCGRWAGPDQFKSKAKGRRFNTTKTCLRCRENKVRISCL